MVKKAVIICPFHDEKTPGLVIDYDKDEGYCFGCKKKYTREELEAKGVKW
jgi:DNA primase